MDEAILNTMQRNQVALFKDQGEMERELQTLRSRLAELDLRLCVLEDQRYQE